MSISLEWLINKSKKKVYAVGHAKGIVRNSSTVDKDLTAIENNITAMGTTLDNLGARVTNIAEQIANGGIGGGSTNVYLGAATNIGSVMIPTEGWEADGEIVHLDITNSSITETTVPVVALSPDSFEAATECGLKPYCRTYNGYMRLYAKSAPSEDLECSLALIGDGTALPTATTQTAGVVKVGNGVLVDPMTKQLSIDTSKVTTQDDLVDEDEVTEAIKAILSED